jgi:hypothetical protein
MTYNEPITASDTGKYWRCARDCRFVLLNKRRKGRNKTKKGEAAEWGTIAHDIVLHTIREVKKGKPYEDALSEQVKDELEFHSEFQKKIEQLEEALLEVSIFDKLSIPVGEAKNMQMEESFYIYTLPKMHTEPDILWNKKIYDLKFPIIPPKSGIKDIDCVTTIASTLPVEAYLTKIDKLPQEFVGIEGVYVIYPSSEDPYARYIMRILKQARCLMRIVRHIAGTITPV